MSDIPARLYCEALYDDYEDLRILLRGDDSTAPMLRLLFESRIAYRNINESYRLRTLALRDQPIPPLAIVDDSPWVSWLRLEAGGVLDAVDVQHYAITTPEDCIDIAAAEPPRVEWLHR